MGLFLSKVLSMLSSDTTSRILMIGLDAAGKTTILYKLKLNETVTTIPTIGFNVETVSPARNVSFTVWDVGGQEKIRPLWRHYFQNTHGIIYVVDSNDRERLQESSDELNSVLDSPDLDRVPVVIIANKQDLPYAQSPSKIADVFGLNKRGDRKWHVQGSCGVSGDGLYEAVDALTKFVKEFKKMDKR